MARKSLPPGFRFHPTDEELVLYYLKRKVMGKKFRLEAIAEVNIYRFSPWDLPDKSCLKSKDLEWFFFCPREKKYASGARVKRATENGYWKTTGRDRLVYHNDKKVGTVKTLIFHLGHAPQGERTDWVLHEYHILDSQLAAAGVQDTYVLCKIFKKNGAGPKNGAQYGAPFDEADWADDDVDDDPKHDISIASDDPSTTLFPTEDQSCRLEATGLLARENTSGFSLIEGPSVSFANPAGGSANEINDEIVELLASFTDDSVLLCHEYGGCPDDLDGKGTTSLSCLEEYDIYNGLGDLDSLSMMENDASYLENNRFLGSSAFIELDDLLPSLDSSIGFIGNVQPSSREIFRSHGYESVKHSVPENQLPEGTYTVDNHQFRLGKGTGSLCEGITEAAYDLGFALSRSDNGTDVDRDIRRGSCADN